MNFPPKKNKTKQNKTKEDVTFNLEYPLVLLGHENVVMKNGGGGGGVRLN